MNTMVSTGTRIASVGIALTLTAWTAGYILILLGITQWDQISGALDWSLKALPVWPTFYGINKAKGAYVAGEAMKKAGGNLTENDNG